MAALVTMLLYLPVGALVAIFAFAAFDVPLHSLVTFAGAVHPLAGFALWWGILFVPAVAYAALCGMEPLR